MELYYHLSLAEARKRSIQLPTPKQLRNAFNVMFEGRVLEHRHGGDLEPRSKRHATAFGSKFNRMFPALKAKLHDCVTGKRAENFMPEITFGMLLQFKEKKAEMADKGIKSDSDDADDIEEWQHFLAHLIDDTDTDTDTDTQDPAQDEEEDEEEEEMVTEDDENVRRKEQEEEIEDLAAKESDAIAALVSLANLPADTQISSSSCRSSQPHTAQPKQVELTIDIENGYSTVGHGCATPELTRSARTSFSQAESVYTEDQPRGSFEGTTYIADGYNVADNAVGGAGSEDVTGCKTCNSRAAEMLLSSHRLWAPIGDGYLGE